MHACLVFFLLHHTPVAGDHDPTRALHETLSSQVFAAFDSSRGGFVGKNGVPVESAVELAMVRARVAHGDEWWHRAAFTMRWTHGLLDTLTGGYFHGGRGKDSGMESLDKRADSNARRLELLLDAWKVTGEESHRKNGQRLAAWFERVLVDGRGGFVSAQVGDRELEPAANGQAIHAWLAWAAATRDPMRRNFALRSLDRVWKVCWTPGLGLLRKNSFGDVIREPLLVDQVEMGRAFVLASYLCGRAEDRERARSLGDLLVQRFEERGIGGFRTQSVPDKNGSIKRAKQIAGENARAARFLYELAALTSTSSYREAAWRCGAAFRKEQAKLGLEAADWALAMRASFAPDVPEPPRWSVNETNREPVRKPAVRIRSGRR